MVDNNYMELSLMAIDGNIGAMIDLARYALSIEKHDVAFEWITKAVMISDYIDSPRTVEAYEEYASLYINGLGCEKSPFMVAFCYYSLYKLGQKMYCNKLKNFLLNYKTELFKEVQYKLFIAQIEINSTGVFYLPRKDYNFFMYLMKELSFSTNEMEQFKKGVEILDVNIEKISDSVNSFETIYLKKQVMIYINKSFNNQIEKLELLKNDLNRDKENNNQKCSKIIESYENRAKDIKNNIANSYSTIGDVALVNNDYYYAAYNYYNGVNSGSKNSYDKLNGIIDKKDVYRGLNERIKELFSFVSGNIDIKFETNEFDFIIYLMKYYDFIEKDIKLVKDAMIDYNTELCKTEESN